MGLRGPVAGIQPFAEISRRATTIVYKGHDSSLDRFVLLKVLRPEFSVHEDIARRFRGEARLLAKVSHPNVVSVYAYGEDDGATYLTTEFVDGQTLDELLASGPPPFEISAAILLRIARGLAASHAEGVLHRDLKPDNILVSDRGQVKITDFGLAVAVEARDDDPLRAGTLAYMAPEVVGGAAPTVVSDLFGAGAVMFELLTGRRAFAGENDSEILDAVLNTSPLHGVESYSDAPSGLLVLCSRLLQKDPSKRIQSARELEEALGAWLESDGRQVSESEIAGYVGRPDEWQPGAPVPAAQARLTPDNIEAGRFTPLRWAGWAVAAAVVAIGILTVINWRTGTSETTIPDTLDTTRTELVASADVDPPVTATEAGEPALEGSLPPPAGPQTGSDPTTIDQDMGGDAVSLTQAVEDSIGLTSMADSAENEPPGIGRLAVALSPWASIWVDGDSVTTTSGDTLEIPAGSHEILLRNPEFPDVIHQIRIDANRTTPLNVSLWATVARLSLTVIPWASVEIDGAVVDTIPPQIRPFVLTPGPHRLRLIHPDFGEIQREIVLREGEHREMAYNMRDASPR